jgi:hypothetical protein
MSDTATEKPAKEPLTTRDKVRRLGIGLFVMVCLAGIGWGASRATEVDSNGDAIAERNDPNAVEISGDPDLIDDQPPGVASGGPSQAEIVEQTIPADGAETLRQAQIGIDLGNLYNVVSLSLNGTRLPEDELTRRAELNQVFFQPAEDATFESLPSGHVCAVAEVERSSEPGDIVRSVQWCFEVT